jgi:prevent-host-death family protein
MIGPTYRYPMHEARERLAEIVLKTQDPSAAVLLTRYGTPVAAVVSMEELRRIRAEEEVAAEARSNFLGRWLVRGMENAGFRTPHEAAAHVRQVQMDRKAERAVLQIAGMRPVEGGELAVEVEVAEPPARKRWFRLW